MHKKTLEDYLPHSDTRRSTFYLDVSPQMDFFGTRSCLGALRWLRVRGRAGGRASASGGGGRHERGLQDIHHMYILMYILCDIRKFGFGFPLNLFVTLP